MSLVAQVVGRQRCVHRDRSCADENVWSTAACGRASRSPRVEHSPDALPHGCAEITAAGEFFSSS